MTDTINNKIKLWYNAPINELNDEKKGKLDPKMTVKYVATS